MQARSPTSKQQQFFEMIYNNDQLYKINKKMENGVELDNFDVVLNNDFQKKFSVESQQRKNSTSPTRIYKVVIANKPYYVKSFAIPAQKQRRPDEEDPESSLLYEKEVYRYIRSKAVGNKEYKKHFAQMLLSAIDKRSNKGYIFTQNTGGIPLFLIAGNSRSLQKYFNDTQHTITAQFTANIFTQLLYVISLLQGINIVHNDLHFGNVLIVKDDINTKTYTMFGETFKVENHPYSLVVYDFDMASIVTPSNLNNPFRQGMCSEYGRCKNYLYTDLYIWLVHLLGSQKSWAFVDSTEKRRYIEIVSRFKENLTTKPKGFWQWLFGARKDTQQKAIDMIELKYTLQEGRQDYPPPIFHASCENYDTRFCYHPPKAVDAVIIARSWKNALVK